MPPNVGEVRKALRAEKPAARSCSVPAVEHGVDRGRERGALDRDLPVALDEHEQDVLAAQAGQQPVAGRVAEAVVADLVGEDALVVEVGLHRLHLVDGQAGGARGGDRRAETSCAPNTQQSTQTTPSAARPRERPAAVAGRDPGQAQHRQGRADEQRDGRAPPPPTTTRFALGTADRVAQRLDADPGVARSRRPGRTAGRRP